MLFGARLSESRHLSIVSLGQDMLMMATLLSKVQLLRDLKSLQMEAKAEEQKRQESLMQSNSKVGV